MAQQEAQYTFLFFFFLSVIWVTWYRRSASNPKSLPFPPGPKGLPIVGNLWDLPSSHEWYILTDWKKIYGDIIHIQTFGKHVIYLNSWTAVKDLLRKRSAIYSDRPRMIMMAEIVGWDFTFPVKPYGPELRTGRKAFHEFFNAEAVVQYRPYHILEARLLLSRLLKTPEDFLHHVRRLAASTIMRVTYGIEVKEMNDIYIAAAEKAVHTMSVTANPGSFVVDTLPILKYVPDWFPGASFKRIGKRYRRYVQDMIYMPLNATKDAMARGDTSRSVASLMLQRIKDEKDQRTGERLVQSVTGIAFAGGADTTVSALQTFFLAMALHPTDQGKAQAQIDSMVGTNRLPEFDDISSLSYVEAVLMEIMRWRPVVPLTTAHAPSEDDEYEGYFIPKGTAVVANAWALLHDEEVYPQPEKFLPERFLNENGQISRRVQNPYPVAFGQSRRSCPGKYLAMDSMIIVIASILATFNIEPAVDENGQEIPVRDETSNGMIVHPLPFKCKVTPRRENVDELIQVSLDECR